MEPKVIEVDKIIKNAKIYTVNDTNPWAEAMAIKYGKIIYVGAEEGLKNYNGLTQDMHGRFIMPGIIDSHLHLGWGSESLTQEFPLFLKCVGKKEIIEEIKEKIKENPNLDHYRFMMYIASLNGEKLTRDELDEACCNKPLLIIEME